MARVELTRPLRESPALRRIAGSFLVTELGDGIAAMLFPLVVERTTGSGLLVGLAFAVIPAAALVGLPIGGVLADRFDRRRVLRTSFLVRAGLLAGAVVVNDPVVTIVCLALAAFGGSIDNPAAEAAIREVAGDHVQQVATIRKVVRAASGVLGLSVGALLFQLLGVRMALVADVATFLVAMVLLPRAALSPGRDAEQAGPAPPTVPPDAPEPAAVVEPAGPTAQPPPRVSRSRRLGDALRRAVARSLADGRAGLAHMAGSDDLRLTAVATGMYGGVVSALLATVVVWFGTLPGTPEGAYGWALASYSVGSITGLLLAGMVPWRIGVRSLVVRTSLVTAGVCALGVVGQRWWMMAVSWALWGLAYAPFGVVSDSAVVRRTPRMMLGRAYAGLSLSAAIGQIVGGLLAGGLSDLIAPTLVVLGLAGVLLCTALVVLVTGRVRPSRRPP